MMPTFNDFLIKSSSDISLIGFMFNIVLAAILSTILRWVYIKHGESLSNRWQFSKNFILLSMTTMLIITIVKSSLALSLGLVGALSIIRFRSAIKEPEELAYLFISISIGLGLGANQTSVTVAGLLLIIFIIIGLNFFSKKNLENQNLYLSIENPSNKIDTEKIINTLKKYCSSINLSRLDESNDNYEVSFIIEIHKFSELNELKKEILGQDKNIKITFFDNKSLS